jgi:hypothetical protein
MPDIKKENTKYFAAIMQSVESLHKAETEVENEKVLFAKFADFLTKNADEISKFHAVENEIVDFLQKFPFAGKIDFPPVRDKLLPLSPLRQKLMEMGNEAKKLAGFPDRYNCHKAMEICKQLTMFCLNEMKPADYDKVTAALDKNIPKLLSIQKEFEKENQILANIKKVLQQYTTVLNKFPAYKAELQQFVASFPNNRNTDLKTVESHLAVLGEIHDKIKDIDKTLTQIKSYADRYNKSAISQQIENILSSAYLQMKISDTDRIDAELKKANADLKSLMNVFDEENKETTALCDKLKKKSPELWQEDTEQIVSVLDSILKSGTQKANYTLQHFYNQKQSAKTKRIQDIADTKQKYAWLNRKRYARLFDILERKYLKFSDFQQIIEDMRKARCASKKLRQIESMFKN